MNNPAMLSVIVGAISALVPIAVILLTRFSDRKQQRAQIAQSDANRDKTYSEIAAAAANQAEQTRLQLVEIRKIFRGLRDIFEDVCLPLLEQDRPELAPRARADLERLDELL